MRGLALLAVLLTAPLSAAGDGTVRILASGGKSISGLRGQADTQALSVEVARGFSPRTEIGLALGIAHVWQPRSWFGDLYREGHEKAQAASLIATGRLRLREASNWKAYGELGFGPWLANRKTPAATSRFNFVTEAGLGLELRMNGTAALIAGYRFSHISNAGQASRNPGWNVSSVQLGMAFRRR